MGRVGWEQIAKNCNALTQQNTPSLKGRSVFKKNKNTVNMDQSAKLMGLAGIDR